MKNYYLTISIDPGISGAASILEGDKEPLIYRFPLKKAIINKKNKNIYDMIKIRDIFKEYKDKNILFVIEKQNVRQGEGSVSAMTIGKNYGQLLGIAYAFEFKIVEVTPQQWKKHFPELINDYIREKKEEAKKLRDINKIRKKEINELKKIRKEIKGKEEKKQNKNNIDKIDKQIIENKKQVDKINRQVKVEAKKNARELAAKLYPALKDKFIKINTDGLAESLLIGIFGKENYSELVQI